jgi:transposase InsO family protein
MSRMKTDRKVKSLRTDNGTEFVDQEMGNLLNEMGIKHERTIPYSPEQNGSVERHNRTIVEMARTMIHVGQLPLTLWLVSTELVNTAVYIHKRVPNRKEKKSPYELQFGNKPRIDHLKVIGSEVHTMIRRMLRAKLDKVSWKRILVGYGESTLFYRVYDPETDRVFEVQRCKDL